MPRRIACCCLAVGTTLAVWSACSSSAQAIEVVEEGCDGLDLTRFSELLRLELGDVWRQGARDDEPRVELLCGDGGVDIAIVDPITSKRTARRVEGRVLGAGAERLLALATVQLFTSSWLELLLPATGRPTSPASSRARDRAEASLEDPIAPFLGLRLSSRLRDVRSPFVTVGGDVRGGLRLAPWSIFATVGVETGSAGRRQGEVRVLLALLGVGAQVELTSIGPFLLRAGAELLAGPFFFEGRPENDSVLGHEERAAAVEGRGHIVLAWPVSDWCLGLVADVGVTALAPDAQVTGEPPVRTSGLSASLALELSFSP